MSAYQISLVFMLFIFPVKGSIFPVCFGKSSAYDNPPKLPTLPDAFQANVQANIVMKNYSMEITEFYDSRSNLGAIRATRNGHTVHTIWDYNKDEKISIYEKPRSCLVSRISSSKRPAFGPCMPNGNGSCSHIESVAELFRFGAKYNETYMGQKWIRGIRCNHWQACINHNYSSFTLDYYFSVAEWNSTFGYPQTVVRAEVNGTMQNRMHVSGGRYSFASFRNVYDFFHFIPGPPKASAFQVPRGFYCKGMENTKQEPQIPFKVFSMEVEMTFPQSRSTNESASVSHFKEMYDSRRNLVQLEMDPRTESGSSIAVYDFNTEIIYNISIKTQQCHPVLMSDRKYYWRMLGYNDSHRLRLKNTMDLFFRRDKTKSLIYMGSANVRGIDADVWLERFNNSWSRGDNTTNAFVEVREVYFSSPSWNIKSWSLPTQHQVPVRFDSYIKSPDFCASGKTCHWTANVFNFNSNPQLPVGAFDIRLCFPPNQRRLIYFALIGDYNKYAQRDKLPILYAVMDAITTTANISSIRISSVEVYRVNDDDQLIGVKLYLLDKPTISNVRTEKSLKDAVLAVRSAVESGRLSITFVSGADSNTLTMAAKRSSYYEGSGHVIYARRRKSRGVPGGAVAAIAVFMLAVGLCIGLGVAHWHAKRKGFSLFAYQRQGKE